MALNAIRILLAPEPPNSVCFLRHAYAQIMLNISHGHSITVLWDPSNWILGEPLPAIETLANRKTD